MPQLHRISWWSGIAVAQIEVWAVSKQALSLLDCGRRLSASLDEATTLVAQLESCEAGLGRTVLVTKFAFLAGGSRSRKTE